VHALTGGNAPPGDGAEEEVDVSVDQVRLDSYEEIHEALHHPHLSRCLDKRPFEAGNPRAGTLSLLHGDEHRRRRRMENKLFQRRALVQYERELFPQVLEDVLDGAAVGRVDLFELGGALSVVLAARRAGVDHDGSRRQLTELFDYVKVIAQAAAVLDIVGDRNRVQAETIALLRDFDERYVTPTRRRRERLLDALAAGETDDEAPHDLLTVALRQMRAGDDTFADHALLVREAGLFLHGGSHTSAQTLCNAFHHLFGVDGPGRRSELLRRVAEDPLDAQRCVHETVRLRPPNPEMKRLAEQDVVVAGTRIARGTTVVLDARQANRDPARFGARPERFDPDREIRDDVPLWGLSFGAGPHICIGRSVAGGFPLTGERLRRGVPPGHLFGLVARMVQAVAARGVGPDPEAVPEPDHRTTRGTRWRRFPVRFPEPSGGVTASARRPTG
jgi:cytochrome P450